MELLPHGSQATFIAAVLSRQVLAKFLGLLTFCPNWGISVPDAVSTTPELNVRHTNENARHEGKI